MSKSGQVQVSKFFSSQADGFLPCKEPDDGQHEEDQHEHEGSRNGWN